MNETNAMLRELGTGVNLDMTAVVERQVRSLLTSFRNEIKKMSAETKQATSDMGASVSDTALKLGNLTKITKQIRKDGSVSTLTEGFDKFNQKVKEVYRCGELAARSITKIGPQAEAIEKANKLYAEQLSALKQLNRLKAERLNIPDNTPKAKWQDERIGEAEANIAKQREAIKLLDEQVVRRSQLVKLADKEAQLSRSLADKSATQAFTGSREIDRTRAAYQQLSEAIRNYNAAAKTGNTAGRAYWSQNANDAGKEIRAIEAKLGSLNLEEGARKRLLDITQKAHDAESQHANVFRDTGKNIGGVNQLLDSMGTRLVKIAATYVSLRALTTFWREATQYAQQYYDKLNEIRIVSGMTQMQVNDLGATYRRLTQTMSVSSTEIASAAVEFWRQGLPEAEVNKRLTATVQYAKISAMAFEDAAQLMTAATNTMSVSGQRVADVWAYLGDASASGADEVGKAMQKASSGAKEFGVSFEWLGAWIATVSEKTRMAPEVIGTAFAS